MKLRLAFRTICRIHDSSSMLFPWLWRSDYQALWMMVLVVKNLPDNAGDTRALGSIPGSGRSPGGGSGNPLPCSCLGNPMDRGAWWAQRIGHDWATAAAAAAAAKSRQLCPTLCNPIDGSPPGSSVPGILQARAMEWIAISFSNAWKRKVKLKSLSRV